MLQGRGGEGGADIARMPTSVIHGASNSMTSMHVRSEPVLRMLCVLAEHCNGHKPQIHIFTKVGP